MWLYHVPTAGIFGRKVSEHMAKTGLAAAQPEDSAGFRRRRPIDLVHLARQTMGDRALEVEILKMFDAQLGAQLQRLHEESDSDQARMVMHTLKGSAFGVGARTVGQLAQRAEAEIEHNGAVSAELIADLDMAAAEVSAFIADMIEG